MTNAHRRLRIITGVLAFAFIITIVMLVIQIQDFKHLAEVTQYFSG